jgi:phage gp36-like protein
MERGAVMEEARSRMEHDARWGSRAARDRVHGGEDDNSEHMTQQHVMGESDGKIFFREIGRCRE